MKIDRTVTLSTLLSLSMYLCAINLNWCFFSSFLKQNVELDGMELDVPKPALSTVKDQKIRVTMLMGPVSMDVMMVTMVITVTLVCSGLI